MRKCGWIWRRFYAERMTRERKKKKWECGSESCDGESEETELKQTGRSDKRGELHTLRLESSQSITERLSISCALLVAAQHPNVSLHV